MKKCKPRLAAFLDCLDPFFCRDKLRRTDLVYLVIEGSAEQEWAEKFLAANEFIVCRLRNFSGPLVTLNWDAFLKHSDFSAQLPKHELSGLLLGPLPSEFTRRWCAQRRLRIAGPAADLQDELGDKISFDRFARRHALAVPAGAVLRPAQIRALPFAGKTVIQEPRSDGGEGTFFVSSWQEVRELIKKRRLNSRMKYLWREFVEGDALGVTLFISGGMIVLSGLRRQCYVPDPVCRVKRFCGVQWVPTGEFSRQARRRINDLFLKAGRALHQRRYYGFANFDFILDQHEKPLLIECNPRLSASSAQLFAFPELSGGWAVGPAFLDGFFEARAYSTRPRTSGLPDTCYAGSAVELLAGLTGRRSRLTVRKPLLCGCYRLGRGRPVFADPNPAALKAKKQNCLVYVGSERGDKGARLDAVGRIITNVPAFSAAGGLSPLGKKLFSFCDGMF